MSMTWLDELPVLPLPLSTPVTDFLGECGTVLSVEGDQIMWAGVSGLSRHSDHISALRINMNDDAGVAYALRLLGSVGAWEEARRAGCLLQGINTRQEAEDHWHAVLSGRVEATDDDRFYIAHALAEVFS